MKRHAARFFEDFRWRQLPYVVVVVVALMFFDLWIRKYKNSIILLSLFFIAGCIFFCVCVGMLVGSRLLIFYYIISLKKAVYEKQEPKIIQRWHQNSRRTFSACSIWTMQRREMRRETSWMRMSVRYAVSNVREIRKKETLLKWSERSRTRSAGIRDSWYV